MSMEHRVQALEKLYGTKTPREEDPAEVARRRAELKSRWLISREKAAREEAEGKPGRRIALDELKETMKERIRRRTGCP